MSRLVLAVPLLLSCSTVSADVYTQTVGTSNWANTSWTAGGLTIGKFNTSFARLDSIDWTLRGGAEVKSFATNNSSFNSYPSIYGSTTMRVTSSGGGSLSFASLYLFPSGSSVLTPHSSGYVYGFDSQTASGTIPASELSTYTGAGSLTLSLSSSAGRDSLGGNPVMSLGSIDVTYNYTNIGMSASDPILPTSTSGQGVYTFSGVPSGRWFDPSSANAYRFDMTSSGDAFVAIHAFPTGFAGPFTVLDASGEVLGRYLGGESLTLPLGTRRFTVAGISRAVGDGSGGDFPIQLDFNRSGVAFTMTPTVAAVPEPSSMAGLALGIGLCLLPRRGRKPLLAEQRSADPA